MPIYTVGAGKTYDSADGILLALNAIPNDFTAETEDHIVEVYPGYDYVHNMSTKKVMTNTSASKRLIIKVADGYAHKGVFGSGVKIFCNDGNTRFYMSGNYIHILGFNFVRAINGIGAGAYAVRFNGNSNYCKLENLMFDMDGTNETPITNDVYSMWMEAGSFDYGLINNCIGWYTGGGIAFRTPAFLSIASTSATGTKIQNCLSFGASWHYYSAGLPVQYTNCGGIGGAAVWQYANGSVGSNNNYGTETGGPGANYINNTKSNFKFFDIDNKKFNLRLDSPLIGTGIDVTDSNPLSIDGQPWNSNHRSPYNATVIYNIFGQPPEDIDYIRGNWLNGIVFNTLSPGRPPLIGFQTTVLSEGLGYSHAGFIADMAGERYDYRIYKSDSYKKITISTIFKGPTSGIYTLFGNATQGLLVSSPTQIGFHSGSFTAKITPSDYVDVNDYYSVVLSVDLEKSSDSERVKLYLFQKGFLYIPTITFSGTAPGSFEIHAPYIRHVDHQGITSVWDRSLSFEEIYNILWDPYIIYRNEKKLLYLTDVIKEDSNLWFLRKFIMRQ